MLTLSGFVVRLGLLCVCCKSSTMISFTYIYFSQQETVKRIPPKNYAENYVYKPNKLRICRTK